MSVDPDRLIKELEPLAEGDSKLSEALSRCRTSIRTSRLVPRLFYYESMLMCDLTGARFYGGLRVAPYLDCEYCIQALIAQWEGLDEEVAVAGNS